MRYENRWIAGVLFLVVILVTIDFVVDYSEKTGLFHFFLEGLIGLFAVIGIVYLLKRDEILHRQLNDSLERVLSLEQETQNWKKESEKYVKGLSLSIDQQLARWALSPAEKEVALLLLKGLSLKEVAEIRGTTEKTARIQSMAIYSKSGLSGRSELAAFFLEDLLGPQAREDLDGLNFSTQKHPKSGG